MELRCANVFLFLLRRKIMPFNMFCANKACHKQMEPYIDLKTDKIFCSVCDVEIPNVNYFTKFQMRSLKQIKPKSTISYSVKCSLCFKEGRPVILKNDIVCLGCKKPLTHLSIPFKNMLKDKLKDIGKDE